MNLLTSALFFHSRHIVLLGLLLFSRSVTLLSPFVLKLQIDLSDFLLLHLYVTVFITSLLAYIKLICL